MTNKMNLHSATAAHITVTRMAGSFAIADENTGNKIGQADIVRGFAHYYGVRGSAHQGFNAVIRGGIEGLRTELAKGIRNGRDDRH